MIRADSGLQEHLRVHWAKLCTIAAIMQHVQQRSSAAAKLSQNGEWQAACAVQPANSTGGWHTSIHHGCVPSARICLCFRTADARGWCAGHHPSQKAHACTRQSEPAHHCLQDIQSQRVSSTRGFVTPETCQYKSSSSMDSIHLLWQRLLAF